MQRSKSEHDLEQRRAFAERIRQALIDTALATHEDAGIRGLCCEGAWEAVVTALRGVDLAAISSEGSSFADSGSESERTEGTF